MKRCWTDLEANGLLDDVSEFYCAVILDEDETVHKFRDVYKYLDALKEYDDIVFHNGIGYDYYALEILTGQDLSWLRERMTDTLVMSRVIYANIKEIDFAKWKQFRENYPLAPFMFGRHSLKAWGLRLGCMKGDFDPANFTDKDGNKHTWKTIGFSQEMLDYNVQDCVVTKRIWELMVKKNYSPMALELEHDIAWLMMDQELNGFKINVPDLQELYAELCSIRSRLKGELQDVFGYWFAANGQTTPKKTICYKEKTRGDLTQGATYTKIKRVNFNPASRAHIARCLKLRYKWIPTVYTDTGEPAVDSEILEKLPYPEAPKLKQFFDIDKITGQIGDGKNAWLRLHKDGYIHGRVNPNGAGTGRAAHSHPNVAQVPKGPPGSYGHRCRQAYTVPDGWFLLGTDASGLELRCLANRLYEYDNGAYAELVVNGDVHWHNTLALGLVPKGTVRDKHNPAHEAARDTSKRWIYAFLYGSGDELLGEIAGYTEEERDAWREARAHVPIYRMNDKKIERAKAEGKAVPPPMTPQRACHILKGSQLRKSFLKAIPAISEFQKDCKQDHKKRKGVDGLDGRFIATRSGHSATNFQLQGDGALVCKLWGVLINKKLKAHGLKHGWKGDYAFCAWVHDEYQIACRTREVAELVGETAKEAMQEVGRIFEFNCQLDAEYDIGTNWSETH